MNIESREYKLLVNHQLFADGADAAGAVWDEIQEAVPTVPTMRVKGKPDEKEVRRVCFLDTPQHTLRRHGLVFRRRTNNRQQVEYTLKCRSEDRYFAAGTDVAPAAGLEGKAKFEEDIAPLFRCRFSHSSDVVIGDNRKAALKQTPATLREGASLFPVLGTLRIDGCPCDPATTLATVNNIVVDETVLKGGKFFFDRGDDEQNEATVALILWTRGKNARPAIAELSFRLKDRKEHFSRRLAIAAQQVYQVLQRLDCAQVAGMTKTEYVYRDGSRD